MKFKMPLRYTCEVQLSAESEKKGTQGTLMKIITLHPLEDMRDVRAERA